MFKLTSEIKRLIQFVNKNNKTVVKGIEVT